MSTQIEKRILAALCKSREEYERVKDYIADESTFSATASLCTETIKGFYARDPDARSVPKEVLAERVVAGLSNPKHVEAFKNFVASLDWDVSVPNLLFDLRELKRNSLGTEMAGLLANRTYGRKLDTLISAYAANEQELSNGDAEILDADRDNVVLNGIGSEELVDRFFKHESQYTFPYPSLNRICAGGARGGHHILVFARPEVGKTLITLDLVRHLLAQHRVLYIGNEDPISDITLRLYCCCAGVSQEEVRRNPGRFDERAFQKGYGNFIGASLAPGRFDEIDDLFEEFKPGVVVVDQIRNLDTGDDNRVTGLEKAATGMRNFAKRTSTLAISVTQAGDSAEGKACIEFSSDIDSSKTGIPGAIDLAIGVGGTREDLAHGTRTINISKNKLGGRHEYFQVTVDTKTGQVQEI